MPPRDKGNGKVVYRLPAPRPNHAAGGNAPPAPPPGGRYRASTVILAHDAPLAPRYHCEFIVDQLIYGAPARALTHAHNTNADNAENMQSSRAKLWSAKCESIILQGCMAKFSQHADLCQPLLENGNARLFYRDTGDLAWSAGLDKIDARIGQCAAWPESNVLGSALMYMRASLIVPDGEPTPMSSAWFPVHTGCVINETC